jgi:FHA domain
VLEPASVALKFAFLAVLYLFLLWVARSALKDLRRGQPAAGQAAPEPPADATGLHAASVGLGGPERAEDLDPVLRVEHAAGLERGAEYDILDGVVLGRGAQAEIRIEDPYASSQHARIIRQGDLLVLEDLGSTNGTYLNGEIVRGPQPLHPGDKLRIGDNEFSYWQ